MVTGPGNIYVTAAKRLLRGLIGIDSEAGTTEIAVLADDTADPVHVAADLICQAEHDPSAASVLVTDSRRSWPTRWTPSSRARWRRPSTPSASARRSPARSPASCSSTTSTTGSRSSTPTPPSTWRSRPATRPPSPRGSATRGRSSSARTSPVSLGDYCAGSNHVLPTGGCARHSVGLSVQTFLRGIHVVDYTEEALRGGRRPVVTLADAEDLPAHGQAVSARFDPMTVPHGA